MEIRILCTQAAGKELPAPPWKVTFVDLAFLFLDSGPLTVDMALFFLFYSF